MSPRPGDTVRTSAMIIESSSDSTVNSEQWETERRNEARQLKKLSDILKANECPLFNGKYCEYLSKEHRNLASELEKRLNDVICGSTSEPLSSQSLQELRLLIAQGDTVAEFKDKMKEFDFSIKCNVVWSSETIAYRCNTCAHNPCMSLCAECFANSNHEGHDYNLFFSQAGGACDCGNAEVLKETGFCFRHGENAERPPTAPLNVVSLGEFIISKLLVLLFLYFRGWSRRYKEKMSLSEQNGESSKENFCKEIVHRARPLIDLLQELVGCGGPIRDAVAAIFADSSVYFALNKRKAIDDLNDRSRSPDFSLDWRTHDLLIEDVQTLKSLSGQKALLGNFTNLLDEMVFWMVRLVFPQPIINLCLSLLSYQDCRNTFAKSFFRFYDYIADLLVELSRTERSSTIHSINSRIVHISVQLLTSEAMSVKLDKDIDVKLEIITGTYGILKTGLQTSTVTQAEEYFTALAPPTIISDLEFTWQVYSIERSEPIRKAAYWTFISDLQNLFTHAIIARRFLRSPDSSLRIYIDMIASMQGMNLNYRVVSGNHVEYDTAQMYQVAFHLEWEVSSLNMFSVLAALTDEEDCMMNYLTLWKARLEDWLIAIHMNDDDICTPLFCVTYHLPLHRHISAGISRCIGSRDFNHLVDFITDDELFLRKICLHPLRIQACRAETAAGMWARNGNAARNQAFYYAQAHYNTAFVDCDVMLIKYCASYIEPEWFMTALSAAFHLKNCFSFTKGLESDLSTGEDIFVVREEWVDCLIDGALRLLLDIITVQCNEEGECYTDNLEREIVAALAISDLTYSKLKSSVPEKGSCSSFDGKVFDEVLQKVAVYNEPDQGSQIEQGVYVLKNYAWLHFFDPVFCRFRASTAREYNDALLRSEEIERSSLDRSSFKRSLKHLWVPYRLYPFSKLWNIRVGRFLACPSFFSLLYSIIYSYIEEHRLNESIFQAAVYLLTLSVKFITSDWFTENIGLTGYGWNFSKTLDYGGKYSLRAMYVSLVKPDQEVTESFMLSMFGAEPRSKPSILALLLKYLEEVYECNEKEESCCTSLTDALEEQLKVGTKKLDYISGYAIDYVGRLLCLLNRRCEIIEQYLRKYISQRQSCSKADHYEKGKALVTVEPLKDGKRTGAKRRQQALLEAHKKKTAALMKKLMVTEGFSEINSLDTSENPSVSHYECAICNDRTPSTLANPIGLLTRVLNNCAVEHSVSAEYPSLTLLEVDSLQFPVSRMMMKAWISNRRMQIYSLFSQHADMLEAPAGIEVRSCGHYAHFSCYYLYVETLLEGQLTELAKIEIACPVCRSPIHTLLPLLPDIGSEKISKDLTEIYGDYKKLTVLVDELINDDASHFERTEADKALFAKYKRSCRNFALLSRSWIHYQPDVDEILDLQTQTYLLGLVKANCERNYYLSGLAIADHYCRELPTRHLLHGARHQCFKRDIDLAKYQWQKLTQDIRNDHAVPENIAQESTVPDDQSILSSSTVEAKIARMRVEEVLQLSLGIPSLFCDLKTTLIRISLYIISNDFHTVEYKRMLLEFVYQRVLHATIVRTAWIAVLKIPTEQMTQVNISSIGNEVFATALDIANTFTAQMRIRMELTRNKKLTSAELEEALRYACTDFARFVAQLWHESGIKIFPGGFCAGRAEFDELHKFLTGSVDLSLNFSSLSQIRLWIGDTLKHTGVAKVLSNEPLIWRGFALLELPTNYDEFFSCYFGRECERCNTVPKMPFVCLLCARLLCLDTCCAVAFADNVMANEVERHAVSCGSNVGCFLSVKSSLIILVSHKKAAVWGSVYLDSHGEEDRNLRRGKPLYLSERRVKLLREHWILQSYGHLSMNFFNFEHLPTYLRDAHYLLGV